MATKAPVPDAWGSGEGAAANSLMRESMPFTSTCPTCAAQQLQHGFSPAALQRLLQDGHPIEAYCVMCDRFWPVGMRERVDLAKALAANEDLAGPVDETIPFTSVCPKCFEEQPQQRYSGTALRSLLKGDHAIEAYCVKCDAFWDISPRERSVLAKTFSPAPTDE